MKNTNEYDKKIFMSTCVDKDTASYIYNKLSSNDGRYIAIKYQLSSQVMERYMKFLNPKHLSHYQKLPLTFIEKYKDVLDWKLISHYQKLPEEFIEKFAMKVDWDAISHYQKLSLEFINKHKNEVNWNFIKQYQIRERQV